MADEKAPPSAQLQLEDSRLTASHFEFLSPLKVGPIALKDQSLNVRSKVSRAKREVRVFLDFKTTAVEEGRELFRLAVSYYALFRATPDTNDAQLEIFAKGNAPAIVFPTLRACIATLTLAASQPPLTLPIINFQKLDIPVEYAD